MKNRLLSKIRASYFFNFFALGLLIVSVFMNYLYKQTQKDIVAINHQENIEYVKSLSENLSRDIQHILKKDFLSVLAEDAIAKKYIESDLQLFVTTKYKYIYLVSQSNLQGYVYLANAKKMLNNRFTTKFKKSYERVYQTKKAYYFKNSDDKDSWATYLSPILVDGKVETIIVITFSILEQKNMFEVLEKLNQTFQWTIVFFSILGLFVLLFSYLDSKREQQKRVAFKELKIKTLEITELNESLASKIHDEVKKNRVKDAHLVHQARLAQMGEMISMIAHQWRQPLASISAQSAHLLLKAKLGGIDKETLEKSSISISQQSQYLSETIDDFRDFFSPDKEKMLTSYTEVVKSVENIISSSIIGSDIKIVTDLSCEVEFESYPNELKQVILNLVKNAQDALIENNINNGLIEIKTYIDDNAQYILEVADNAGGIREDIREKIFDPYFSTKNKKDGTGLGLHMSKMIVEEHCNGKLNVRNKNNGAVFSISLGDSI